ncbi:MAG: chemotaxis-specific protein-glutamate methyltransferase CheB [Magnetococcales bacterium]|nr:chemotaxis-specific protein-glutamate methyltransferase CheB [Magnetococcales bacterium]
MIKVLVVDDSALMRKYIREMLEEHGDPNEMEFMTARDGRDALVKVHDWQPDVVTLDINMPEMDGLSCLARIMKESPRPVVMVSSLTEKGAMATLEAMALGAVDYIAKPGGTVSLNVKEIGSELVAKVRAAAHSKVRRAGALSTRLRADREQKGWVPPSQREQKEDIAKRRLHNRKLVLVGSSTGGPRVVEEIFAKLPADFPVPILLAQHMPANFTIAFAKRLDGVCKLRVEQVSLLTPMERGTLYVARGDSDVVVRLRDNQLCALPVPLSQKYIWHPSVGRMVESAAEAVHPSELVAVQLTGMGDDGAREMTRIHEMGCATIAESEQSAVVYGMPKELVDRGGADRVLHADEIAGQLMQWLI